MCKAYLNSIRELIRRDAVYLAILAETLAQQITPSQFPERG
jgi:hypothetical protein